MMYMRRSRDEDVDAACRQAHPSFATWNENNLPKLSIKVTIISEAVLDEHVNLDHGWINFA